MLYSGTHTQVSGLPTVREPAGRGAAATDFQCLQPEIKTEQLSFFRGNFRKLHTLLWEY